MKLLICGDLHLKESLGYSEYVPDRRRSEKKEILDFITKTSNGHDGIVFLGDQFHHKNNPSEVIREFVEFIESFGDKEIYLLAGNHEKQGDGRSAIDFMEEVNKNNWHVITNKIEVINNMVFCPYFHNGELNCKNFKTASQKLTKMLPEGKILFTHHTISDTTFGGIKTNSLQEILLPKKTLLNKYELVIAGHIHDFVSDDVIYAGSVFNNEVGETQKYIHSLTINGDKINLESIKLPGRKIVKIENPKTEDFIEGSFEKTIARVILTKQYSKKEVQELRNVLIECLDGFILQENIKRVRESSNNDFKVGMTIRDLLSVFSKQKGLDESKVLRGFDLIQ